MSDEKTDPMDDGVEKDLTRIGATLKLRKSGLVAVTVDTDDERRAKEEKPWPGQYL